MNQKELETLIKTYQTSYYDGHPEISDDEFDALWDKLSDEYPDSDLLTSVGEDTIRGTKRNHLMVVGSQDKFNTEEGLHKWLSNENIRWPIIMEPKFDGIGFGAIYEKGNLKYVLTRGNGYVGDDITDAAKASGKFPLKRVMWSSTNINSNPIAFSGEVRGEIIIDRETFNEKYSQFKNPRNFTAGAMKNEDFSEYTDFDFYAYDVMSTNGPFATEYGKLMFLMENGFETTIFKNAENVEDILNYRNEINPKFYPFNIDGIVLKQNEIDKNDLLELRPKKQRAFKWKDEGASSILREVEWTLSGRTMTPVAIFDPVDIEGSTVKRANLCNPNLIEDLGIKIGDEIEVVKRGMIIPKIERVITDNGGDPIEIPTTCPECGSPLINEGTRLYCSNENCKSSLLHRIDKWIRTLDVKNFGPALQEFSVNNGYINCILDLYNKDIQEKIEEEWGLNAVKAFADLNSKTMLPLAKVIGGFDIENLGVDLIQTLVDEGYTTFEDLCNIKEDDIIKINGWSNIRANLFINGISQMKDEIKSVIDIVGVQIQTNEKVNIPSGIENKHICVTGKLNRYTRKEIENAIKERGGIMDSSVTSKTDILCTNDQTSGSSKLKNASKYNTKIITENELLELMNI